MLEKYKNIFSSRTHKQQHLTEQYKVISDYTTHYSSAIHKCLCSMFHVA